MLAAKAVMVSTGREPLPAIAEPNQSTSKSSVLRTTGSGMASNLRPAAKAASWAVGLVFMVIYANASMKNKASALAVYA